MDPPVPNPTPTRWLDASTVLVVLVALPLAALVTAVVTNTIGLNEGAQEAAVGRTEHGEKSAVGSPMSTAEQASSAAPIAAQAGSERSAETGPAREAGSASSGATTTGQASRATELSNLRPPPWQKVMEDQG